MKRPLALACAALLMGVTARHAMVATTQHDASDIGVAVLRAGGNAIDAAVAVGYALAVVDPCCGNIGGGGFMLVRRRDGYERFINFRETAPQRATSAMYLDASGNARAMASRKGWLAVAVPGTVAGLETARREFGTMSRQRLMAPAIALARNGFVLQSGDLLRFAQEPNVAAIFSPNGTMPDAGTRLVQTQLAQTLSIIARGGEAAFYRGPIARAVVATSKRNGGILTLDDFARYRIEESAPLHCRFGIYDIASAPPAEFRRHDTLRNSQHLETVSAARLGLARRPGVARRHRGRTTRVRGSQRISRRSGFRAQSNRATVVAGIRAAKAGVDSSGSRDAVG